MNHFNGTIQSAIVSIKGKELDSFLQEWEGTIQWIGKSPYRPMHRRKNWFLSLRSYELANLIQWHEREISYQTCRASGPGGQHVNKTETAVRATYTPSGISVVVSDRRSQWQNKKEAAERLKGRLMQWSMDQLVAKMQDQCQQHNELTRGGAVKTIKGEL